MGYRVIIESATKPLMGIAQRIIVETSGHESLLGERNGDPRGVASDPASSPFFRTGCRSSGTTGWVKHQVARIGSHEDTSLNNLFIRLNNVCFF